jgi:hypothetical protein
VKKWHAHCIFGMFDLLALSGAYLTAEHYFELFSIVVKQQEVISFQQGSNYFLLLLFIPMLHLWSGTEKLCGFSSSSMKKINYGWIAFFVLAVLLCKMVSITFEHHLVSNGYMYCEILSKPYTFSEFSTYTIKESSCYIGT